MQLKAATAFIYNKLQHEIPAQRTYHNLAHTKDVQHACEIIAQAEGVTNEDKLLLDTAALFHDTGFTAGPLEHEKASCMIARSELPRFGYQAPEIETICRLIMATRLPQSPSDLLSAILCDADLDYLGRDDFYTISAKLYQELVNTESVGSKEEWDERQIAFLEKHRYFTQFSLQNRQARQEIHLNHLKAKYI